MGTLMCDKDGEDSDTTNLLDNPFIFLISFRSEILAVKQ